MIMVWNIGITMTYTYYTLLSADFIRLQPLLLSGHGGAQAGAESCPGLDGTSMPR